MRITVKLNKSDFDGYNFSLEDKEEAEEMLEDYIENDLFNDIMDKFYDWVHSHLKEED